MCVPAIEVTNGEDIPEYTHEILLKILKDGYVHKCKTPKACNYLPGTDHDITHGGSLHKVCFGKCSDGFTIKKICRVNKFEKMDLNHGGFDRRLIYNDGN